MIDPYRQAFDRHAQDYDRTWGADPIAQLMRREVHSALEACLTKPSRVLDLGCGVGIDSAWLSQHGHHVLAVDRSAGMLAQAAQRVPDLEVLHAPVEDALESLEVDQFDAALLDFGVVNCLDVTRLSAGLARCIRPGGQVFIVPMPRLAPAWVLAALSKGRWGQAVQRLQAEVEIDVGGIAVPTRYLSSGDLIGALEDGFVLESQRSLGLTLPPPGSKSADHIGPARVSIERYLSGLPLLRHMGDHLLLRFRRVPSPHPKRGKVDKLRRRVETLRAQKTGHIQVIRTLILELTEGCQSHCVGCSHRGPAGGEALDLERVESLLRESEAMGAEELLLTGGEPLLRPDIVPIMKRAHQMGLRVVLLTNGLALSKFVDDVARYCDTVVVSLDAVEDDLYREIRGVSGLALVRRGIQELRALAPQLPIQGRCTVTHLNAHCLQSVAHTARELGLAGISYLAADQESSSAFGRAGAIELPCIDIGVLEEQIQAVWEDPGPPFITNSFESLERILRKARADQGGESLRAPRCDAPWTSAVVGADLSLRPCFFLGEQGDVRQGLMRGLAAGRQWRQTLRLETEPVCARCVCWARLG